MLQNCASRGVHSLKETQGVLASFPEPVTLGENEIMSAPAFLWTKVQYLRFSLNDEERKLHRSAVYHSLNNAELGAITRWHSKTRLAQGQVRVIHQWPTSDGYCRVYQAYIQLNGAARHFTNNACKRFGGVAWGFLK